MSYEATSTGYDDNGVSHHLNHPQLWQDDPAGRTIALLRRTKSLEGLRVNTSHTGNIREGILSPGLNEYLRGETADKIPFYVIDHHNLLLFAIAEAVDEGAITLGSTLVNFDAHADQRPLPKELSEDLKQHPTQDAADVVRRGVAWSTNIEIDQFISTAQALGLVDNAIWIHPILPIDTTKEIPMYSEEESTQLTQAGIHSEQMKQIRSGAIPPNNLIVSIDIDYFAFLFNDELRDSGMLNMRHPNKTPDEVKEQEMEDMREVIRRAGVIILATSPGYINQNTAVGLVRELMGPLLP